MEKYIFRNAVKILTKSTVLGLAIFFIVFQSNLATAQDNPDNLPFYQEEEIKHTQDWLIDPKGANAKLYKDSKGNLVFSNGLISRTFSIAPDVATIAFDNLVNGESLLRSVRQEASVTIDGIEMDVGGLYGQPIHNYLLPEWLDEMTAGSGNFHYNGYVINPIKERFAWQKRQEWMPQDLPWPPQGKELTFSYKLADEDLNELFNRSVSDEMRIKFISDDFKTLDTNWKTKVSKAHNRTSFINEGKPGEIMALNNTFAFAEQKVPEEAKVFQARINPGTDNSKIFGPGMVLVLTNQVVKINLRTEENRFGFFNGSKTTTVKGLKPGLAVNLRFEISKGELIGSYAYEKDLWIEIGRVKLKENELPKVIRIGKTDWTGEASDHPESGELMRCLIETVDVYGEIPDAKKSASLDQLSYLKDITVNVHYALYDNIPLMSKWITVDNKSTKTISLDKFKSEILAITDPESSIDQLDQWRKTKLYVESDYAFGDGMTPSSCLGNSVFWNPDPLYLTQVNYRRQAPYLLECYPKFGPDQDIEPGQTFESFRSWELAHLNYDRERQGLEKRKMYRTIAPWVTENPIMMHVRKADDASVKTAIDQCEEVGFEMVIMTFGSGFNLENQGDENLNRMKELAKYAHDRGVALGGYSLLASRSIDAQNDVVMPEGQRPTFGNSPCLESEWGREYFSKLYNFYKKTDLDLLEHDGAYPGDACYSENHPGHKGLEDSQWNQRKKIIDYYRWCRSKGIYLNIPDWYFLNGSTKTGMGYRETNWSLPRKQQEIIERQNVYDGTWGKTPSMGWMFVPLVQYHGGGEAATIEPLKDHLSHYEQRLANLFGSGVQACYRGPRLYDAPETKVIVKKWVDFYKAHRSILDSDVMHIRRPDGQDYDGLLHVNPDGEEKGLLMLYNPLEDPINKTIDVNLYYTGLSQRALISKNGNPEKQFDIGRDYNVKLDIEIPARGWTWYVIK